MARQLHEGPSLRRPILKPCEFAVKGAWRRVASDPFGPLDRAPAGIQRHLSEEWVVLSLES